MVISANKWGLFGFIVNLTLLLGFDQDQTTKKNTAEILKESRFHDPRPPVILIPGVISSRLVAWKQKKCKVSNIEIQDVIWLNLKKVFETSTYDRSCWLDCLKLGVNGSDPTDCKLRVEEGISSVAELSPGNLFTPPTTSVFTLLVRLMAKELGYDANNIIGAPYDWRLAPMQLEIRDSYFSVLKFKIESAVRRHGRPAVVIAYSMGNNIFQYFVQWLRLVDRSDTDWRQWLRKHIWGYVGVSAPLLGAGPPLKAVLSGHKFGLPISEAQSRDLLLTCPSTHFIKPRLPIPDNSTSSFAPHTLQHYEPIVTIRGVERSVERIDSTVNDIAITTDETTETHAAFTVQDVEDGSIFQYLGERYSHTRLTDKYHDLLRFYHSDPLQPMAPYDRPPVKHVVMVYGVDVPTEVGFVYRLNEHSHAVNEEVSAAATTAAADYDCAGDESNRSLSNKQTNTTEATANVSSLGIANSTDQNDFHSPIPPNPLRLVERVLEDSTCRAADHKAHAQVVERAAGEEWLLFRPHSGGAFDVSINTDGIIVNNTSDTVNDSEGNGNDNATNTGEECCFEHYVLRNGDSNAPKKRHPLDHPPSSSQPVNNPQEHSGDGAVPYVSLSYAKRWLNGEDSLGAEHNWRLPEKGEVAEGSTCNIITSEITPLDVMRDRVRVMQEALKCGDVRSHDAEEEEEKTKINRKQWTEIRPCRTHRHFLDSWGAPSVVTEVVSQTDPYMETFHTQHANGDTTVVMEVSGVDHLEVLKHPSVHEEVLRGLLDKMGRDLGLGSAINEKG